MADSTANPSIEPRDDRVLPLTRAVAFLVIPFLIAAFLILYVDGTQTERWFAWQIPSRLTTALMGSGYLGGAYFFLRAGTVRHWHRVQAGFLPITIFTAVMFLATVLHWEAFLTDRWPFWIWLVLYIVTPLLIPFVWWHNRKTDPRTLVPGARLVPFWLRTIMAAAGVLLLLACIAAFVQPLLLIDIWPWTLSPLTSRVLAGWYALLGAGSLALAVERRWSAWPIPMQTIAIWQLLLFFALAWHRSELNSGTLFNWYTLYVVTGLLGLLIVAIIMRRQPRVQTHD